VQHDPVFNQGISLAPVPQGGGVVSHPPTYAFCRFYCPSFQEYARVNHLRSRWAGAFDLLLQHGVPQQTTVRALAYKWQRVIFRRWLDQAPYSPELYEAV
jgi:hypothetical protein